MVQCNLTDKRYGNGVK